MAKTDLDLVIRELQKTFGEHIIKMGSDINPVRCLPIGIPQLDYDLGGGFLWNRISIIKGREQTGKTSLATLFGAEFQKIGGIVYWIDLEKAFDANRAGTFGINVEDNFIYTKPGVVDLPAEEVFKLVRDAIKATKRYNLKTLIVLDSLAANVVEKLFEEPANKVYGGSSAVNNTSIAVWNSLLGENQMLLIINQLRDNLEPMAKKDNTPGGWAQNYFASSILSTRQADTIKDGTEIIGQQFRWTVEKSRRSSPKETGSVEFIYETGFVITNGIIDTAEELGLLEKGGSWYTLPEGVTTPDGGSRVQGKEKLATLLTENQTVLTGLLEKIYQRLSEITPIWNGENE